MKNQRTDKTFVEALGELMRGRYADGPFGTPTIAALVRDLGEGWHYENVRKILAGERGLPMNFVAETARVFGKEPEYFLEYRVDAIHRALKGHPEIVGPVYETVQGLLPPGERVEG